MELSLLLSSIIYKITTGGDICQVVMMLVWKYEFALIQSMNRKLWEHGIRSDLFGEVGSQRRLDLSQMFLLVTGWESILGRVSNMKISWPHEASSKI